MGRTFRVRAFSARPLSVKGASKLRSRSTARVVAAVVLAGATGGRAVPSAGAPPDPQAVVQATTTPLRASTVTASMGPTPTPVAVIISVDGSNGVGRINGPGLDCAQGGDGASWHYAYESGLLPGGFTSLPGSLRMNLDVHAQEASGGGGEPSGFLRGSDSTVALVNERGTARLRLSDGGDCANPTATVSPDSAHTRGTWTVDGGSGAYEGLTGSGSFRVDAGIAPGADNPWSLQLDGTLDVGQPALAAEVVSLTWGPLDQERLTRRPSVRFRVSNTGADAVGLRLTGAASPTPGVTLVSGAPADLGYLLGGESVEVTLRYQLALLGPCALVVALCGFDAVLATAMADALDRPVSDVETVQVSDSAIVLEVGVGR